MSRTTAVKITRPPLLLLGHRRLAETPNVLRRQDSVRSPCAARPLALAELSHVAAMGVVNRLAEERPRSPRTSQRYPKDLLGAAIEEDNFRAGRFGVQSRPRPFDDACEQALRMFRLR